MLYWMNASENWHESNSNFSQIQTSLFAITYLLNWPSLKKRYQSLRCFKVFHFNDKYHLNRKCSRDSVFLELIYRHLTETFKFLAFKFLQDKNWSMSLLYTQKIFQLFYSVQRLPHITSQSSEIYLFRIVMSTYYRLD